MSWHWQTSFFRIAIVVAGGCSGSRSWNRHRPRRQQARQRGGASSELYGSFRIRQIERSVFPCHLYLHLADAVQTGVLFLETSSLSGENATQPFILLARSILLAVESGRLDPEKPGSGVIFGERRLRRMSSWSSGGKGRGFGLGSARIGGSGGCCSG